MLAERSRLEGALRERADATLRAERAVEEARAGNVMGRWYCILNDLVLHRICVHGICHYPLLCTQHEGHSHRTESLVHHKVVNHTPLSLVMQPWRRRRRGTRSS
jgi:hypothetical protein